MMKQVTVTYHGHACFTLESEGFRTVLDPYEDGMIPGVPPLNLEAEEVLCSHSHGDHNAVSKVKIRKTDKSAPYTRTDLETAHDDQGGKLRGMNQIRIFDFDGYRVAHLGDLGTPPEGKVLEALRGVHCLLIPVGGTFTIDPAGAWDTIERINPVVTVPMHYRTDNVGFDVLAHINDFTQHYSAVNICDNSVTLTGDEPKQILVINYKP